QAATEPAVFSSQQRQQWRENCPQLKQRVAAASAATTAFTPLPPAPTQPAPVWQIRWQNMSIPVPALDYNRIGLHADGRGFVLVTDDTFGVFAGRPRGLDLDGARQQPLLQALWGTDTTLGQVIAYGYTITPDD